MMNEQLGNLSEDEIRLVRRHREVLAYRNRSRTLLVKILLAVISLIGLAILTFCFMTLNQINQYKANGEQGEIPAPLSWIFKPKQPDNLASKQSPVIFTSTEAKQ